MNGIINLLKPPGISSARVINRIKRKWSLKKVGHTGTLDPLAAGVLPLCVGKATKVASFLLLEDKTYWAEIILGETRDTDDAYGEVTSRKKLNCTEKDVLRELQKFTGTITQIPPQISAIKVDGERAYRRHRKGENFKLSSREVKIFSLRPLEVALPRVRFWVHCSKGTYIRSIARDLGEALGVGGYLQFLIRTSTGPFKIRDSHTLEEMEEVGPEKFLLAPDLALKHLPSLVVADSSRDKVPLGQIIDPNEIEEKVESKEGYFRLYDREKQFLALVQKKDEGFHPFKVFI